MRAVEWIAAFAGATICLGGASAVAQAQLEPFGLGASPPLRYPPESLWPLPGLILLDWAVLGSFGLVFVTLSNIHQVRIWSKTTWAVCGALVVLMILGAFSIGPYVMVTALCFALAAALAWARQKPYIAADMLAFGFGAFGNLVLLLIFILFGRT